MSFMMRICFKRLLAVLITIILKFTGFKIHAIKIYLFSFTALKML